MNDDNQCLVLDTPEDDALLGRLRRVAAEADAPPALAYELAAASFSLRALDAELAVLVLDSAEPGQELIGVRGEERVRLLSYQANAVGLELQWVARGNRRSLTGQVIGASAEAVLVDTVGAEQVVHPDERGVFWLEDVPAGLARVRLTVASGLTITTPWTDTH